MAAPTGCCCSLWGCSLSDESVVLLAHALTKPQVDGYLQRLELWGNCIGDHGAEALAAMLDGNIHLSHLE